MEYGTGPNTINRENVSRLIVVAANAEGRDLGSVITDIRAQIKQQVQLPSGYFIQYGGQFQAQEQATQTLIWSGVVALTRAFAATRNALMKELSGAAVTENEAKRQLENIGNPTRADFGDKFMAFYNQSRRDFYNKIQTLNDAGFQIPDKLVSRSQQGVENSGQPQAKPQPNASTFQYDPRARRLLPGR